MTLVADIPLRGAGGEPVDFARTIASHAVESRPANHLDIRGYIDDDAAIPSLSADPLTERCGELLIDEWPAVVGGRARSPSRRLPHVLAASGSPLVDASSLVVSVVVAAGRVLLLTS